MISEEDLLKSLKTYLISVYSSSSKVDKDYLDDLFSLGLEKNCFNIQLFYALYFVGYKNYDFYGFNTDQRNAKESGFKDYLGLK